MNKTGGQINLIIGCMFSGKTSLLINRYNRYTIGNKKCLMVKFKRDTRYDAYQVITHDGLAINAIRCEYLYELDDMVTKYDVICIDEIQFYKDAHIMCDKWANQGLIINACGLSGDFNRKPFPVVSKLISLADDITHTKAVCKITGSDAIYSKLTEINNTNNEVIALDHSQELIGGADIYSAANRISFFGNIDEHSLKLYRKFLKLYKKNLNNNVDIDEYFKKSYDKTKTFKEMIEYI